MVMRNKKAAIRKVLCACVCVAMLLSLCACDSDEQGYPEATEKFFVNDFAGVITDTDSDTIYTKGAALNDATTAQAVVITVESLEGMSASDYALNIGREWGVGTEQDDNGVVILLSVEDREIYIAVGYGLEGALPDSKTGRIIDTYGIQHFTADDFSTGLVNIYNSVVNEIYIEYGVAPDENYTPITTLPQSAGYEDGSASKVLVSWLVLIALVSIYIGIFGRRGGLFIFGSPRFFNGNYHHHSGGFGGPWGGSGFGGFRGGGGSFGGGGAGRKF